MNPSSKQNPPRRLHVRALAIGVVGVAPWLQAANTTTTAPTGQTSTDARGAGATSAPSAASSQAGSTATAPTSAGASANSSLTSPPTMRATTEPTDPMDRARARSMPGARPGDAPALRSGGAAVTDIDPPAGADGGASRAGATTSAGRSPMDPVTRADGGVSAPGAASATERRDSKTTARMIGETSFVYRDRAMTLAERELSDGNSLSSDIQRGSMRLSGVARTRVNDSVVRVNEAKTELAKAISRARSANESRWESSRGEVVERYNAYVAALNDARAAALDGGVRLGAQDDMSMPP